VGRSRPLGVPRLQLANAESLARHETVVKTQLPHHRPPEAQDLLLPRQYMKYDTLTCIWLSGGDAVSSIYGPIFTAPVGSAAYAVNTFLASIEAYYIKYGVLSSFQFFSYFNFQCFMTKIKKTGYSI
jgi:hypothetical protein